MAPGGPPARTPRSDAHAAVASSCDRACASLARDTIADDAGDAQRSVASATLATGPIVRASPPASCSMRSTVASTPAAPPSLRTSRLCASMARTRARSVPSASSGDDALDAANLALLRAAASIGLIGTGNLSCLAMDAGTCMAVGSGTNPSPACVVARSATFPKTTYAQNTARCSRTAALGWNTSGSTGDDCP